MLLQYEAESEQHCRDDGHGNVHDLRLPASWPIKRRPSSLDQHSIAALGQCAAKFASSVASASTASAHLVSKRLEYPDKEGKTTKKKERERRERQPRAAARAGRLAPGGLPGVERSFPDHAPYYSSESDLSSIVRSDNET
jgi:hypothetical protein